MQTLQAKVSAYPPEVQDGLARIAETRNLSLEDVLVQAAQEYVEREDKRRAMFDKEVADSRARYAQTGLHINNAELRDWIKRKMAGEDVERPKCHT